MGGFTSPEKHFLPRVAGALQTTEDYLLGYTDAPGPGPLATKDDLEQTEAGFQVALDRHLEQIGNLFGVEGAGLRIGKPKSPLVLEALTETLREVVREEVRRVLGERRGEERDVLTAAQFSKDLLAHQRWMETTLLERVDARLAASTTGEQTVEGLREDLDTELGLGSRKVAGERSDQRKAE